MDILRNYRTIEIQKRLEKMKKIDYFINNEKNKVWLKNIICNSISDLNKRYFGEDDILDVLKLDMINAKSYLSGLKQESIAIEIFNEHNVLNFIVEFNSFDINKSLPERMKVFFVDHPLLSDILLSYKIARGNFNKNIKDAEKLYSTALNQLKKGDKIFYLKKALKVSPLGSLISIRILQSLILIKSGENLGKIEDKKPILK